MKNVGIFLEVVNVLFEGVRLAFQLQVLSCLVLVDSHATLKLPLIAGYGLSHDLFLLEQGHVVMVLELLDRRDRILTAAHHLNRHATFLTLLLDHVRLGLVEMNDIVDFALLLLWASRSELGQTLDIFAR